MQKKRRYAVLHIFFFARYAELSRGRGDWICKERTKVCDGIARSLRTKALQDDERPHTKALQDDERPQRPLVPNRVVIRRE